MGKDFAITAEDRDKTLDRVAKEERDILAEAERQERLAKPGANMSDPMNFNITPGRKLPDGFVNPKSVNGEPGNPAHLCVDNSGAYRPDWFQIYIHKVHDRQEDPQIFPLGTNWLVRLEHWSDVPPEIIESLRSAIEEHHVFDAQPGDIIAGVPTKHEVRSRRRFHWDQIPSFKVAK
jgi:hypothetical protein